MTIAAPTKTALWDRFKAYLASKRPDLAVSLDRDLGIVMSMLIEAQYGIHRQAQVAQRDMFVSAETSTEALDKHADARLPGGRKGAVKASGTSAVRVTGVSGTEVAAGLVLVFSDGTEYKLTESGTLSGTTIDLDIEASQGGSSGNREVGDDLTFFQPPEGIQATAELVVAVTGGEDAESDAALVTRLLDAYQNPPAGGRFSDFRQWATAVEGVATAYCYGPSSNVPTGRRGLGAVDVAILKSGSGTARLPSAALQASVLAAINASRPALARDVSVLIPTQLGNGVTLVATPLAGWEFDWIATQNHTVTAWDSITKELQFTVEPECAVDDRVMVAGEVVKVTSLDFVGAPPYKVYIDTVLTVSPVSKIMYPGGPISQPLLTAIQALFDALGPARGTAADPDQNWEDTLQVASIYDVCMDVTGVRNINVTSPSSDVTPSDTGTDVQLIVPGEFTVIPFGHP